MKTCPELGRARNAHRFTALWDSLQKLGDRPEGGFCQLSFLGCDLDVIHSETVECKDPGFPWRHHAVCFWKCMKGSLRSPWNPQWLRFGTEAIKMSSGFGSLMLAWTIPLGMPWELNEHMRCRAWMLAIFQSLICLLASLCLVSSHTLYSP